MARNTYQTYLMHSVDGSQYEKLIDIKEYPDLGGAPEMLDTTTLSDPMQTNMPGIQSMDALTFTANYDLANYRKLKLLEGKEENYAVWLGGERLEGVEKPSGDEGKFAFKGRLSVFANGGGVNEITGMTITIGASTPVEEN